MPAGVTEGVEVFPNGASLSHSPNYPVNFVVNYTGTNYSVNFVVN